MKSHKNSIGFLTLICIGERDQGFYDNSDSSIREDGA